MGDFLARFLREVVNDNILPLQAFPNGRRVRRSRVRFLSGIKAVNLRHWPCRHHYPIAWQQSPYCGQNVIHSPLPQGQQWTRELEMWSKTAAIPLKTRLMTPPFWVDDPDGRYRIQLTAAGNCRRLLKISGARLENKGQFDGKWLMKKIRCKTPMYRPTVR